MEKYTVLTSRSVLDIDTLQEDAVMQLISDQNQILNNAGIDDTCSQFYIVRFFESAFGSERTESMTIEDAVQCLAIKEGYDVVMFESGCVGFVAYYNEHKSGFQIIGIDTDDMFI